MLPQHVGPSKAVGLHRRRREDRDQHGSLPELTQKLSLSPALLDPLVVKTQFDIIKKAQALFLAALDDEAIPLLDRIKLAATQLPKMSAEVTGKLVQAQLEAMKRAVPTRRSPRVTALLHETSEPEPEPTA